MKKKISSILTSGKAKMAGAAIAINGGLIAAMPIVAHAEEVPGATPTPGVIDTGVMTAVSAGFNSLQSTVTSILVIAVPSIVAIVCTTVGVKYAIKKIKGAMNNAS